MSPHAKGVSPIIASVLILLVTVALVASYTVWTSGVFGTVSESGQEEVTRSTQQLFSDFRIEGLSKQDVFIKNTGSSRLSVSALTVFLDGEPVTHAADFDTLEADEGGTLTLRGLWKFGVGTHALKVSAGAFSDSTDVTTEPAAGAVGLWDMEEGSGTVANDASGNGNTGTFGSSPVWTQDTPSASSKFGLTFDGTDDSVNMNSPIVVKDRVTVEAWVKFGDLGSWRTLFGMCNDPNSACSDADYDYLLLRKQNDDKVSFILGYYRTGGGTCGSVSTAAVTPNVWTHVVGTIDIGAGRSEMFMNGLKIPTTDDLACTTANINVYPSIGALAYGNNANTGRTEFFKGSIDGVRLFDRAYGPDELYNLEQA
ncbi:MAG: hypothetical protein HYS81_03755 [Candidatus Aenigmatarchaeota archaeon]|nr:MAG: hypothetical protein HYS81_03755 [Candidatus Aenigmarchaeota archaeon]